LRYLLDWFYIWIRFVCLLIEKTKSVGEPKQLKEKYTLDDLKAYFSEINNKLEKELPFEKNDERYKAHSGLDWNDFFASNASHFITRIENILDRFIMCFDVGLVERIEKLRDSNFMKTATMYYRYNDLAGRLNYVEYLGLKNEIKQFLEYCLSLEEYLNLLDVQDIKKVKKSRF